MSLKLPEIIVFAGPNGSGKSTITRLAKIIEPYINADDIKRSTQCSDLEAAIKAESLRESAVTNKVSFTFETVLPTDRNLNLLRRAKENRFFIRCFYILTADVNVNIARVKSRVENGGYDVPEDKIRSRYAKALYFIPTFIDVCDVMHIYDNTKTSERIFKKRKDQFFYWENLFWKKEKIEKLWSVGKLQKPRRGVTSLFDNLELLYGVNRPLMHQ